MGTPTTRFSIRRVIIGVSVGIVLIVAALPILAERFLRGAQELVTVREMSTALLQAREEIERIEESGGVLGGSAASNARAIREAASEARDCLSEVERAYQWYELFIFSLPTDCKSMLSIVQSEFPSGEIQIPAAAAPQVTSRDSSSGSLRELRTELRPAVNASSGCKRWRIRQISFRVPSTKGRQDWDFDFDPAPDPFVEATINGRMYRLGTEKNAYAYSRESHITAEAGAGVVLVAYDRDLESHDQIFESTFFLPKEKTETMIRSDEFKILLSCIADG